MRAMHRYVPSISRVSTVLILMSLATTDLRPQTKGTPKVTESAAVREVLEMKRQYDVALMQADSGWFEKAFC
jgi:hypothetical protein